jgi:hypothetical protein
MSFITIGILFFLAILALHLGHALRRDQIIVYRIRKKRYNNETERKEIFGDMYNPFKKNFYEFIPDFYNLFFWLFFWSEVFIHITVILKIIDIEDDGIPFCEYVYILCPVMLLHVFFIILTLKKRRCYYKKYEEVVSYEKY